MTNGTGPFNAFGGTAPNGAAYIASTQGVLGRRLFAYLLDIVFVFIFASILALVISIVGVITFGLGWSLFAILPATGVIYSALTVGGARQATLGMRIAGLRAVDAGNGGPVDWITAAVHSLLFYVAAGTFVLWVVDIFVGLARPDRRLAHDLLVGLMLVRQP
jgi:uncharacterized RDD family membrane protein YckC